MRWVRGGRQRSWTRDTTLRARLLSPPATQGTTSTGSPGTQGPGDHPQGLCGRGPQCSPGTPSVEARRSWTELCPVPRSIRDVTFNRCPHPAATSTTENCVGGRCARVVRSEDHHPSVKRSSSQPRSAFACDHSSDVRTCLACIQLGALLALRGEQVLHFAVQRRSSNGGCKRRDSSSVRHKSSTTGACTRRKCDPRARADDVRDGRSPPLRARAKRRVLDVGEHAGSAGSKCAPSNTWVLDHLGEDAGSAGSERASSSTSVPLPLGRTVEHPVLVGVTSTPDCLRRRGVEVTPPGRRR
jgi:hypothetical protein